MPSNPITAGTGDSSDLRISPLCPWKDVKSQLSSAKLLIYIFFSLNEGGVCGE